MKIIIDKEQKKASLVFTDNEIEILKNNNNSFVIRSEDLPHFKNHLMHIVFELSQSTPNVLSRGHEEISSEEVTKK
tara:strand:- start:5697 stop:5924 length:228 start_codon:yes stop_codon:yes gene_type:complete